MSDSEASYHEGWADALEVKDLDALRARIAELEATIAHVRALAEEWDNVLMAPSDLPRLDYIVFRLRKALGDS